MLFLESKTLNRAVDTAGRTRLLQELHERSLVPLIRSHRLRCFEDVLLGMDHVAEMETSLAASTESTIGEPFVRGDLFCFQDYILFLVFEDDELLHSRRNSLRSTHARTVPKARLVLPGRSQCSAVAAATDRDSFPQWETSAPAMPQGFRTFVERQDADSLYTSLRKETMSKRILAASKLEDESARVFLRTARNAHEEGYAAKLLTGHTESAHVPIQRLEDAGLVEREVQISCRKTGHALFRLPNPHALAVVTVSDATCSECGAPVADENVEEVIAPTQLASSLLEDGSWLVSRIHFLLREMGVPEREIARWTRGRQWLRPTDGEYLWRVVFDRDA